MNASFSSWFELLSGVPQGSVLAPLLFNLFIDDLFYVIDDLCNYADDNTINACDTSLSAVLEKLEKDASKAISWFKNNGMKLNSDKCFLLVSGHKHECTICTVGDSKIIETHCVKLLGVLIDSKLTFSDPRWLFQSSHAARINVSAAARIIFK